MEEAKEKKILINIVTYVRRLQTALTTTLRKFEENKIFITSTY